MNRLVGRVCGDVVVFSSFVWKVGGDPLVTLAMGSVSIFKIELHRDLN